MKILRRSKAFGRGCCAEQGMENAIRDQILEAAATLLCGLSLGLVYEVLGELRHRLGRAAGILLDLLFCCGFAWTLFLLGMGPGKGRLRLYMPLLALLGMACWRVLLGSATHRISAKLLHAVSQFLRWTVRPLKKCLKFLKKYEKILKSYNQFLKIYLFSIRRS